MRVSQVSQSHTPHIMPSSLLLGNKKLSQNAREKNYGGPFNNEFNKNVKNGVS